MAEELDWDVEAFDEAFQEVFENGMARADFKARLVWLPNALKHNKPESPNVVRSWRIELDLLPECDLKNEAISRIREILESIGPSYVQAFDEVLCGDSRKPSSKPSGKPSSKTNPNQEQEQEQETVEERDKSLSSTSALPKLPDCPHLEILSLFAEHLPTLAQPRPESWDGKRADNLRARWRWLLTKTRKNGERYAESKEQGLAWFARFFAYVSDSDFLMGRSGNFAVTLDWLVNQTNFSKVLDGNYANRTEVAA